MNGRSPVAKGADLDPLHIVPGGLHVASRKTFFSPGRRRCDADQGAMTALPAFPMPRSCPMHPPADYAGFRRDEPIKKVALWNGTWAWVLTRYEDVRKALGDDRFSAVPYRPDFPALSETKDALYEFEPPTFFRMDPPEHGVQRGMLASEFAFRATNASRPGIQALVDDLIDAMVAAGPSVDFIKMFASPLPSLVVTNLLGVPFEDHHFFEERTQARLDIMSDRDTVIRAGTEMLGYIDRLLTERENDPKDDLLSRLVIEQIRSGHLSHDDAVAMGELMLRGGHETTASQLAVGMLTLFEHPEQLQALRDDPSLLNGAIEEMLRFNTIVHFVGARVAVTDVEIGGQMIRQGDGIYALISAANRDPSKFADPDVFDIRRKNNAHLAFGYGTHGCIGQLLARAELQIAFATLLERLPNLRLAVPSDEIRYKSDFFVYGLHALPVTWDA